jgi:ABC-2 type transport system ATP-binding protein
MTVIEVEHLHKRYGDTVAVDDVSFTVEGGEIFGILGPNGAGKTTTVECIAGLRAPDGGRLRVLGLDPLREQDRGELHERVGVQLQQSALPEKLEVGEALELYAAFYREPADPDRLLEALDLTAKRGTRFAKLSGGQQQRLSIALALIGRPTIAILDELTTGLDPGARRDTWALVEEIRAMGVTILLVTHFMEEAERLCDRIAVIDSGRVVAVDTPAGLTAAVDAEHRVRFRPSRPIEDRLLTDLPAVTGLTRAGGQIVLTGTPDLLNQVTSTLARAGVVADGLRIDQVSLEDAFVALTGRRADAAAPDRADPVAPDRDETLAARSI